METSSVRYSFLNNNTDIIQLFYLAYYGRPADPGGLDYWVNKYPDNKDFVVQAFVESQEFEDNYNTLSNSDLIAGLYQQLFGRIPDTTGMQFYVGLLDSGEAKFVDIVIRILDGILPASTDILAIDNRLAVANAITNILIDLGPEKAKEYQYGGENSADKFAIDDYFSIIDFDTTSKTEHITQTALNDLMVALGVLPDTEPPVFTSGTTVTILENSPTHTVVYDAQAMENHKKLEDQITYRLSGYDALSFVIDQDNGIVKFISSPNYEARNSYSIDVIATDASNNETSLTLTISVIDVDEYVPPPIVPPPIASNTAGYLIYDWDSSDNSLTIYGNDDDGVKTLTIMDSDGNIIQQQNFNAQVGSMVFHLQAAYEGIDTRFTQIPGFEGNEYNAYKTISPFTFILEDINGYKIENTFTIIINKALNLPLEVHVDDQADKNNHGPVNQDAGVSITSVNEREMILQASRDGASTLGQNSFARDIWIEQNEIFDENGDILGDHIYLQKQPLEFFSGSVDDKWVWTTPALGTTIIGQERNESTISFHSESLGSFRVDMQISELGQIGEIFFYNENDEIVGSISVFDYYGISVGATAPGISVLRGNEHSNYLDTYGGAYIGYGMGGNDIFTGNSGIVDKIIGNSWLDGGEGTDILNLRYDVLLNEVNQFVDINMEEVYEQLDENNKLTGGWYLSETIYSFEVTHVIGQDYFKNIEIIILSPMSDYFTGNSESNHVHGGRLNGYDEMDGRGGDDYLIGGGGADDISGGDGNDIIFGDSNDEIYPGVGQDAGFYGVDGDDNLEGGAGDDILITGGGDDYLSGFIGLDTFVLNTFGSKKTDTTFIVDFTADDVIQLADAFSTIPIQKVDDNIVDFNIPTLANFLNDPNNDGDTSDAITAPPNTNTLLMISNGINRVTLYNVFNDDDGDSQIYTNELYNRVTIVGTNDVDIVENALIYSNLYHFA